MISWAPPGRSGRAMLEAGLYVVATPIGNRGDVTARALEVLQAADVVAAEDTRTTGALLSSLGLSVPLVSVHEHNEARRAPGLVQRMLDGAAVALVSDAGTPLVSDPGYRLVRAAIEAGLRVHPVPGASALTAALSVSGLPSDRFVFEGFLPARDGPRRARIAALADEPRTLVLFESAHRVQQTLGDLRDGLGEAREAAVCRELTKRFETVLRGPLQALCERLESDADQRRGEFVLVIGGAERDTSRALADAITLARALCEHLPASQAARVAAGIHGVSRRELYDALQS
ncbi:MAG: 16S rRNA (cytidine(1402)-2'-O)-methyltransferase [Xanthomonadales bacterium]|nr:16S rRNA (cytidine(1402)-2'-O)-methyltransferase [Xanthomonadales bacterium]